MRALGLLTLVAACAVCSWGQMNLKGLAGVRVATVLDEGNGTGAAAERVLTKSLQLERGSIQTETELRLREAGMTIRPADRESYPALVILVSAAGTAAVSVNIYILEMATLDRGSLRAAVRTWENVAVLQNAEAGKIREVVRDGVSEFLNQWLADRGK